jgi:phospholipid/cholesterol/gamma-HCH transport system substrate-binding protein
MVAELTPGTEDAGRLEEGGVIPISQTLPDVNLDEILAALDADTRDYLKLLVNGAGRGLQGRGGSLREVLERFEPTHRDLARVNKLVAQRHRNLSRLIHSLNQLNGALAGKDVQLASLVQASSKVFRAFASEQAGITGAVQELPDALRTTTSALQRVQAFADELTPAADALRPAARKLNTANKALLPLGRQISPVVERQIRPFVRDSRPVVRSLAPSAQRLSSATPDLKSSFEVLNHLFNMLGNNPGGREAPGKAGRDEGYLYWIAWLQHNASAVFSSADANGIFRPITISAVCPTISLVANSIPGLGAALGPALFDPKVCGT